jgi:hypothetical protein
MRWTFKKEAQWMLCCTVRPRVSQREESVDDAQANVLTAIQDREKKPI